jgi:uncharacterized protein YbjQ (UPF0145 family)
MSFPILTTTHYDTNKYSPVGSVVYTRVEALSLLRSSFAGFGALFGGKNQLIQGAMDNLQTAGLGEFTNKVQSIYPNTVQVVGLNFSVNDIGPGDQNTMYLILTITGTCLVPLGQSGGSNKRRTLKRRS